MFDLDQAIAQWRQQSAAGGMNEREVLDELESHLRDDVAEQAQGGLKIEEAFAAAVRRMGHVEDLQNEFEKIEQAQRTPPLLNFAHVTNNPDMTNSNLTLNLEPRWATYAKGAAFLAPALLLWAFSCVFLFPKVQEICRDAGLAIPSFFRVVMALMGLFREHGLVTLCTGAALFTFLEWRSRKWPRYRRASIGVGVFVLNAVVLILITAMFTLALMAAPALFRGK